MKVYVVECDVYAQRFVAGVYSTPELAMAAFPAERPGDWRTDGDGSWNNGLDMGDYAVITETEVDPAEI